MNFNIFKKSKEEPVMYRKHVWMKLKEENMMSHKERGVDISKKINIGQSYISHLKRRYVNE